MDLSLFFAGTAGSVPSARRGLPAVLVRRGGEKLLFDCGEGTQRQLIRSVGLLDLDAIFITHFHADHWLGLPGMLKSFALRERSEPLSVFGPPGLAELLAQVRIAYGRLPYRFEIVELDPAEAVRRDGFAVAAVPVRHKGERCYGYALVEDARPGHLDPALAESLGVTPGPDFGRLQRGETVAGVRPEQVMGPAREGRKVVISGDTAPCETLAVAAHQADVLVHEATFAEEEAERARATLHSTARQAARLAREADVRLLALTHFSSRYAGGELRDEARAVFPRTEAVRDFDTVHVPFPERGQASLERWSDRQARERAQADSGEASGVAPGRLDVDANGAGGAHSAARAAAAGRSERVASS
ncbi:MAG TPA: ribonuclease Z [Solirubrobacteraceae bacterium]|nr:ribonuclease Z [Solirubrobacteraceae bacterium]